jgi:2-isopropylmalate synthase
VPYLPIDPADLGRSYDSVIRVNSQSGKGGVAYLLEADFGVVMPRRMQIEFSGVVQGVADAQGGELGSADIWRLFADTYVGPAGRPGAALAYREHHLVEQDGGQGVALSVEMGGQTRVLHGHGNGPIHAAVQALASAGITVEVLGYEERAMSGARDDGSALACAIVEVKVGKRSTFGVGVDANIVTACVQALCSGVNRAMGEG